MLMLIRLCITSYPSVYLSIDLYYILMMCENVKRPRKDGLSNLATDLNALTQHKGGNGSKKSFQFDL